MSGLVCACGHTDNVHINGRGPCDVTPETLHTMIRYVNGVECCGACGYWPYSDRDQTWEERFTHHAQQDTGYCGCRRFTIQA